MAYQKFWNRISERCLWNPWNFWNPWNSSSIRF